MAGVRLQFFSETLKRSEEIHVLLPQNTPHLPSVCRPPFPVLYLLHGLGDDHNAWLRNSSVERYVENYNLCVVMPGTDRGFYTDTGYGIRHFTYISEELPHILKQYFPISQKREDTFACGLSMGGYGALKLGLRLPERYAAVAAFSAAPMSRFMQNQWNKQHQSETDEVFKQEMQAIFGDQVKPEDDLFALCENCAAAAQKPAVFLCCGEEDFLFSLNLALKEKLEAGGFAPKWSQQEKTAHVWSYWDAMLPKALAWLPFPK